MTRSPDPAELYASVPFVGYRGPLPAPPAAGRSLAELSVLVVVAMTTGLVGLLLSWIPGADPAPDSHVVEMTILLDGPSAGSGTAIPVQADKGQKKSVPEGDAKEDEPIRTAPERTGIPQATARSTDAVVAKPTAPQKPFFTGDQIAGRHPAPVGTTGGSGTGAQGTSNQPRQLNPGSLQGGSEGRAGGGGTSTASGSGAASAGTRGGTAGSGITGRRTGTLSAAGMWTMADQGLRSVGSGGQSDANAVSSLTAYIQGHKVTSTEGLLRDGWLVATRNGADTCAIASDETIVCARPDAKGVLRAYVGGPGAAKYGTTELALAQIARLLGK